MMCKFTTSKLALGILTTPDVLRQKFVEAVDAAITEKEYELKEL